MLCKRSLLLWVLVATANAPALAYSVSGAPVNYCPAGQILGFWPNQSQFNAVVPSARPAMLCNHSTPGPLSSPIPQCYLSDPFVHYQRPNDTRYLRIRNLGWEGLSASRQRLVISFDHKNCGSTSCDEWAPYPPKDEHNWATSCVVPPPSFHVVAPAEDRVNLGAPQDCSSEGNPINPANGNKYQVETDYRGSGVSPLSFGRWYNSADGRTTAIGAGWRHSFGRRLRPDLQPAGGSPGAPAKSSAYATRQAACEQGWAEIRGRTIRLANADAVYAGGVCELREGGALRESLPVIGGDPGRATAVLGWYAERDDGKVLHFELSNGRLVPKADIAARLEQIAGGFSYVENDITELYDQNGKLLSIRDRAGHQQDLNYDTTSRLVSVVDSFGRSLSLSYDADGRLGSVSTPGGGTYQYGYTDDGSLADITHPDGKLRAYHYEDARFQHALTGITDERGDRFATWSYDSAGKAISSEHADGVERVSLTYGADGATTVTDAMGAVRTYNFVKAPSGATRIASLTQPCSSCGGSARSYSYDASGNLIEKTDFNGNRTAYRYNARNLEISRTDAEGTAEARVTLTDWHPDFRLPVKIAEPGRETLYSYDGFGNRLTQTLVDTITGESRTTTYTYNAQHLLESVDGPREDVSDITRYDYDARGNVSRITNALGQVTEIPLHDAHGNPLRVIDPNRVETLFEYDTRQRLLSRSVAGAVTRFEYDGVGQLTKVTLPDASALQYVYDPAHRLTEIADGLGNRIRYTLDAAGNRTKEEIFDSSNTLRRTQSSVFDVLSRLQELRGASGQSTNYDYDDNGNRTAQTEAGQFSTLFEYDALDRMIRSTDPENGVTQYQYNALDQIVGVTDAKGLTTSYTYNAFGETLSQTSPDTGITAYVYDAAGNRIRQTDARRVTVIYAYDPLNRITRADYPGAAEDLIFTYDGGDYGQGRLTHVTDASGTTAYRFNPKGTLASEEKTVMGRSYLTQYTYDAADRPSSMWYPSGRVISQVRDPAGQVTQVSATQGGQTTILASDIRYLPFGPATSWTLGNGAVVTHDYDLDYRVSGIQAGTLENLQYRYDPRGNVSGIQDLRNPGRTQIFSYDGLSRLTGAQGSYGTLAYTYDAIGNRTSEIRNGAAQTYRYEAASHRLESVAGPNPLMFQYDPAGNVVTKNDLGMAYGAAGRHTRTSRGSSILADYIYDARGQRVVKKATPTTLYHHDQAGRLMVETDEAGRIEKEYVHLNGQPLALYSFLNQFYIMGTPALPASVAGRKKLDVGLPGSPSYPLVCNRGWPQTCLSAPVPTAVPVTPPAPVIAPPPPPVVVPPLEPVLPPGAITTPFEGVALAYYLNDHLGTPQKVVDGANPATVHWSADYEPFGAANLAAEGIVNDLRFPGQYYDAETGLHQNWWRDYDTTLGRYLQSDPVGLMGGINTYAYVANNPPVAVDPTGLDGTSAWWWATMQIGSGDYQFWDPHKESRGRINDQIGGRASRKCNSFVWDGLLGGGNPPNRLDGRIPLASDWQSGLVNGYRPLRPGERPILGDVVALDGHVGFYAPLPSGAPGTISASSLFNPLPSVEHTDWGFREGQSPTIMRCECDDP